jgi:hypothetical protein
MSQQQILRQDDRENWIVCRMICSKRIDMLAQEKRTLKQGQFKTNYFIEQINKYKIVPLEIKYSEEIAGIELLTSPDKQQFWMNKITRKYRYEYIMDTSTEAGYILLLIKTHTYNYDRFFKHDGFNYCGSDVKWTYKMAIQTLNYLRKVREEISAWHGGMNPYIKFTTLSHLEILEGIRECSSFIDTVSKHMTQHREKMMGFLPFLLGHGIDSNVALIIYDFAC